MRTLGPILTGALLALAFNTPAPARALEVPELSGRVNDYAGVLDPQRARAIEGKLAAYERQTGHQLALLTVKSLEGEDIAAFGIRVGDQWKLGDQKRDLGLIMIVVPGDRKARIEVGYGLEGDVPDAIAARVIREVMAPAFKSGDYALGIEQGFDALMRAASGEAPPAAAEPVERPVRKRSPLSVIPFLFIIFFLFGLGRGGRGRGGMWVGPMMAGMSMGGHRGGGFGGGGGGGGFRGGGGGFGGGGASGGW